MSDVHAAAASYAVDALSSAERAEFEAHLDGCASCHVEVHEFAETLAELAPLVASAPPVGLRNSVLTAVADLRQADLQQADRQQADQQRAARLAERAGRAGAQGSDDVPPRRALASVTELRPLEPHEVAPLEEHPSVVPEMPWLGVTAALSEDLGRRSRWRERVLGALVAASLILAVALGGWVYVSRQQIQTLTADAQRQTGLLTAWDARVYYVEVNVDRSTSPVSFVVSTARNEALFVGRDLPPLPANSIYQLWTVDGTASTSAGVVNGSGEVRQMLTGSLREVDKLVISIEPGPMESKTPTGPQFPVSIS